jgi:hypothetical protein
MPLVAHRVTLSVAKGAISGMAPFAALTVTLLLSHQSHNLLPLLDIRPPIPQI